MFQSILHKSKALFGVKVTEDNSVDVAVDATPRDEKNDEELKDEIYDFIRNIRDPEKPNTLEDLHVVSEDGVMIKPRTTGDVSVIRIEFNPTVPHCSLATLIGLCIRIKLERNLVDKFKLDIFIKKGTHSTEEEINKQINDKERIAAAMENPELRRLVETCIADED